jgi:hypothetical protein
VVLVPFAVVLIVPPVPADAVSVYVEHVWLRTGVPPVQPEGDAVTTVLVCVPFMHEP